MPAFTLQPGLPADRPHETLAEILLRMRHNDYAWPMRVFEYVVRSTDPVETPACGLDLPDQVRTFHGVYYTYSSLNRQRGGAHAHGPSIGRVGDVSLSVAESGSAYGSVIVYRRPTGGTAMYEIWSLGDGLHAMICLDWTKFTAID